MKKIEKLTPEQEQLMYEVRDEWLDRMFKPKRINRESAMKSIHWLYELANYKKPVVVFLDSPMACQIAANMLKDIKGSQVGSQVWSQVWSQGLEYETFAYRGTIYDYDIISFYDFFERIGLIKQEGFEEWKQLVKENIFFSIQLENVCICSEMPTKIHRNNNLRLHSEDSYAIEWADGYGIYCWNGLAVDERFIKQPETLDREYILGEDNAEKRRCIMERLGGSEYYNRIYGKDGLVVVDEDTDGQGNPMRLLQTAEKDPVCNEIVQILEVIDPSTGRMYNLYPLRHDCTNVWDAKASTFNDEKLYVRHGDVGLTKRGETPRQPLIET